MVRAALDGTLAEIETREDPVFGLQVPVACPGVPPEVLEPRKTWKEPQAYDEKARELAGRFGRNFEQFAASVEPAVREAGPRL
jgi:phosphoenolpyruvate carboxykinase (ATP)